MSDVTLGSQRLSRRRVLSAGAAVGLAAGPLAAACAPGAGPAGDPSAGSKAPATIVYWCNVGQADYAALRLAFGSPSAAFDFDGDGDADALDLGQFRRRFGVTLP